MLNEIFLFKPLRLFRKSKNYIRGIKIQVTLPPKKFNTLDLELSERERKSHGYSNNFTCKCRWCNNGNM